MNDIKDILNLYNIKSLDDKVEKHASISIIDKAKKLKMEIDSMLASNVNEKVGEDNFLLNEEEKKILKFVDIV